MRLLNSFAQGKNDFILVFILVESIINRLWLKLNFTKYNNHLGLFPSIWEMARSSLGTVHGVQGGAWASGPRLRRNACAWGGGGVLWHLPRSPRRGYAGLGEEPKAARSFFKVLPRDFWKVLRILSPMLQVTLQLSICCLLRLFMRCSGICSPIVF